jgi:hypothetical protein
MRQLYQPENFTRRVLHMIECLHPVGGTLSADLDCVGDPREVESEALMVIQKLRNLGRDERRMITTILRAMQDKPESRRQVTDALYRYAQARCVYDSGGVSEPQPAAAGAYIQLAGLPLSR